MKREHRWGSSSSAGMIVCIIAGFFVAGSHGQDSAKVTAAKTADTAVTAHQPNGQSQGAATGKPAATEPASQEYVTHVTIQKKEGAGTVTSFKPKDLDKKKTSNVMEPLQGQAAGVRVIRDKSQQPGSPMHLRIRGVGSIYGSNEPLYVVDGVTVRNIDFLNPNDVASVSILKNPSETAIYGSQGANGVVVITTKKAP
jgi:TonB-dependent SusC/RagA subfamily outer membrane receptor